MSVRAVTLSTVYLFHRSGGPTHFPSEKANSLSHTLRETGPNVCAESSSERETEATNSVNVNVSEYESIELNSKGGLVARRLVSHSTSKTHAAFNSCLSHTYFHTD